MPGVISAHPSKEADRVTNLWASVPSPYIAPMPSALSSVFYPLVFKTFFLFFLSLYQFSHFWAERASCFGCKKSIAITGGREREKKRERERECSSGRETDCYPCQSDPAWRLSSPLIALLISSPLSLDLGQQGPAAGADWRLSFSMISPSLCCFFFFSSSSFPFRQISIRIKTYSRNMRKIHCFLFRDDPGLD